MLRKVLSFIIIIHMTAIPQIRAEQLTLPAPGMLVSLSPAVDLPVLKGIKVHTDDPLKFEFIIDEGDKGDGHLIETEANKLIKYFLASLTTPEKDLWVNLSPYEKDRIVPDSFGQTEMGRDLLAQDYLLKQITASLVYPEGDIGKQFWKKVYEIAGNKNVPINTFNKVWIVPDKAVVYENAKNGTAYVVESSLKVLTEQDYLALDKNAAGGAQTVRFARSLRGTMALSPATPRGDGLSEDERNSWATGPAHAIRDLVIPQLTKEVNTGANFAQLRQVYNSLILATWYKKKIKDSILTKVYADQNKVVGIATDDPKEKERIYAQYLEAFKKGAYNFIKEERDSLSGEVVPRKYFSGGVTYMGIDRAMAVTNDKGWLSRMKDRVLTMVGCDLKPEGSADDPAGAVKSERNYKIDEQGFLSGGVFDEDFVREERQRSAEKPTIVFDMDGTMVGVIPPYLRPGIAEELFKLKQRGYRLVLWTGSIQSGVYGKLLSYPEMRAIFDLIVTNDNKNNMDLSGLGEQYFRDLFLQYHEPMPQGKDRKKPIHLFGYKLLVDDEQYSGKAFRSYEIALPVIGKEPTEGLADRLDAMIQSADIGSLSYNQWREKYKDSDKNDRAMSGEEKDGMQGEIKRLQQKRALTQTELEALEKELSSLNWEKAALVPWVENIHYAWEQPEPEVENELHLWENQIAVRREFLLLAASMMKNVHMTTEEFTQRLKEMNRLLIIGESGGNFYRGAITGLRQSEQSLLKKAGKPRDEQIFLERMPLLRSALEGLLQGLASSTDDEQYIRNVAWFYQKMINRYLFESGNNSLAMNMVNAMLRARGFMGISHHQLDMKYFKTVQPDDVLLQPFFDEFRALVGGKDSAQSVDRVGAFVYGKAPIISTLSNADFLRMTEEPKHWYVKQKADGTSGLLPIERTWKTTSMSFQNLDQGFELMAKIEGIHVKAPDTPVMILDWGAGDASGAMELSRQLTQKGISHHIYALSHDIYPQWKEAPANITFILDDGVNLPLYIPAGTLDLVYSHVGLTHVLLETDFRQVSADPSVYLGDIDRLLKPGGALRFGGSSNSFARKSNVFDLYGFIVSKVIALNQVNGRQQQVFYVEYEKIDRAMTAPMDVSQQQARTATLTIEASLIKRIVEQFQHKFHYSTELLRNLLFGSDLMQIRSIFLIDPVDWELLEAPLDQLEHKLIEKPVNGTRLRFKIERLMQLLKMASAHLPRSESELNDQEKKIVKMIGTQSSAVEAVNFRLLMAEAVNAAAIKIAHPPKESKIFQDHDTIMHDMLMYRVLSMYRSARGSLAERSLLDNILHSADEFFDDAVRRVNADQPDMVAHLEALWDQMLYLPLSDELYAAIAQYEWWFYKANSLQIIGAGIGDAMSTAMQLAKGIPLRKTFLREEFRAKGLTLSQYIKMRVSEFQVRVAKADDAAMTIQGISKEKIDAENDLGGIDLDPSKLVLEQRSSGGQIVMSVDEKLLERLSQARGFFPVVIAVVPLVQGTLGEFLNGGI